jgi:hypothetical protein
VALAVIALAKRFPSQAITEYLSAVIGPIPGKANRVIIAGSSDLTATKSGAVEVTAPL